MVDFLRNMCVCLSSSTASIVGTPLRPLSELPLEQRLHVLLLAGE